MSITQKLNPRERRRLKVHGIVPVDVLDPECTMKELIENKSTHLYRYGCYFQDTNVELEEYVTAPSGEKNSSRFHLQGFPSSSFMLKFYQYDFLLLISISIFYSVKFV